MSSMFSEVKRLMANVDRDFDTMASYAVRTFAENMENDSIDPLYKRSNVSIFALGVKHSDVESKIEIGGLGIIEVITKIINDKFMVDGWYDFIEVGWSFLFSIIDEVPINKTRFIVAAGGKAVYEKYLSHPDFGPRYFRNIRKNLANVENGIFDDNDSDEEEEKENNSHPVKFQKIVFPLPEENENDGEEDDGEDEEEGEGEEESENEGEGEEEGEEEDEEVQNEHKFYIAITNFILKPLEVNSSDPLTQQAVASTLAFSTSRMEKETKIKIGKTGAIEKIFKLIESKISKEEYDLAMVDGLEFLWNVTVGIEENCKIFLKKCFEFLPPIIKKTEDCLNLTDKGVDKILLFMLLLKLNENKYLGEFTKEILKDINKRGREIYQHKKMKLASDKYHIKNPMVRLIPCKDYSGYLTSTAFGSPAWCLLLFDKDKKEALIKKVKTGTMDIREVKEYGQVLYSGLGKKPPRDIECKMMKEYGL
uniref:Protein zer-1 homolog-like C-terminal domain-containing protein n=1 Tax=Meloidogyne incognita TaxID=6306 RepID=A0A914M8E9_MELIC